jgi:NhaP-type Na+/H+ or K+/H+ antiporter
MVKGYGFLAVFVAALALRATEPGHDYHQKLHDFAEELERLMMMVLLVLLGGAMTGGGLLAALTWQAAAFGLLALFVVRPLAGWIGLIGTDPPPGEKAAISFFGIRGIGSIYYLAYALQHGTFGNVPLLWSTTGFIILVSIVLHGITVTPTMRRLDLRRKLVERKAARA